MGLFGPRANRHIFSDFLSLIGLYDTGQVLVDAADRRCVELLNQAQDTMNNHKEDYEREAAGRVFEQISEWRTSPETVGVGVAMILHKLRHCLRDPIPEIQEAAYLLDEAVSAHLGGDTDRVELLAERTNMPAIREWTESLWGRNSPYAPSGKHCGDVCPVQLRTNGVHVDRGKLDRSTIAGPCAIFVGWIGANQMIVGQLFKSFKSLFDLPQG